MPSPLSLTLTTLGEAAPTVIVCAGDGKAMPRTVYFGRWTGLSPKLLMHTVNGCCSITSMTPGVVSVKCGMAVRAWFRRKHKPAAGAKTRKMTCVSAVKVTVLSSRTFRDVGGSLTAPALRRMASEATSIGGCLAFRRAAAVARWKRTFFLRWCNSPDMAGDEGRWKHTVEGHAGDH